MDSMERLVRTFRMHGKACMARTCLILGVLLGAEYGVLTQANAAEIGAKIPNFQLPDASGASHTLHSTSGKAAVIVFWSFKCPVSLAYVDRVEELYKKYDRKGVKILAIDASPHETPEEIRANVSNLKITFPVLLDGDGSVARKFGATHSPSVYILDGENILRYKGAFDNNKRPGENGRVGYADDALGSMLSGRDVRLSETQPFGCSIRMDRDFK